MEKCFRKNDHQGLHDIFFLFRERMTVHVTSQKKRTTIQRKKHKWTLPGEETALHMDNSKMCKNLIN